MERTVTLFAACIVLLSVFAQDLVLSPPLVFAGQISLQITDVTAPPKVVAGERLTANVSVKWSGFDRNARTIFDQRGNTINVQPPVSYGIIVSIVPFGSAEALSSVTDMNVKTSGSKSYGLMLTAPRLAGPWALTARVGLRIRMEATNNTINFMNQHSKDVTVDVLQTTSTSGTVTTVTPVTEQEWVFDFGITQTWVTMKVIIHPGSGQSWDSWPFYLGPPNRFDKFAAYGPTNESLTFNVEKDESRVSVTVRFDEPKQDGYYFYVKFLDTGQPFPAGDLLKADWSWTSADSVAHVVHLWLPERYAVSSLSVQGYTETIREGRVFLTFSGTAQPDEKFYWSLVIKQTTTPPATTVKTQTSESPPGLTSNLLLIPVAAVIVAVAVGYIYARRKKSTPPTRPPKTSSLFCVHCGTENPPLSKFCENCGQELLRT